MQTKNRYWLFVTASHCPVGGMGDFYKSFKTVKGAKNAFGLMRNSANIKEGIYQHEHALDYASAEIYDSIVREIICETDNLGIKWRAYDKKSKYRFNLFEKRRRP
jgi:hypothetical protein